MKSSDFIFRRRVKENKKETLNVTEGGCFREKKDKVFVRKRKDVNEENKNKKEKVGYRKNLREGVRA